MSIFGDFTTYVQLFLILVVCDITTGVAVGVIEGKVSSKTFYGNICRGLVRKLLMIMLMLIVFILGNVAEFTGIIPLVLLFYISGESISILENLARAGVPFPKFLMDMFKNINEDNDNGKG